MTKHTTKNWKKVEKPKSLILEFPTFWWYHLSNDFILKFSEQIFQWKTISSLGILWPNPISSTLFRD